MPTTVQIDGVGEVEFPDSMTPDQITQTIRTKILKTQTATSTETAKPPKQGLISSMAANTVPGVAGVPVPPSNIDETLSKPFVKTEPLSNYEKLAFTQGLSSYLKAQGHPLIASLVEKNPEAVGAINEVDRQVVDFMDSPAGLLTLGVSGLGKVAQRALMAWFGGQAAIQSPETLKKITKAVKDNDPYAASEGILELTTQAEMGLSGIKGVVPKSKAIQLGEEIQQASKDAQLPTLKSATPIVQPGEAKIPPEIVSTMEQARAREGALDEAQSQDIQAQQARQEQAKASKEIQVPETPPEPEREYSSVVEEVRQRGLDTKRKVQAVFPQLSREEASDLVKRAFPEGAQVKPTPPTKTVEPAPSQPPTQPKPETTVASPETPPQKTAAEPTLPPEPPVETGPFTPPTPEPPKLPPEPPQPNPDFVEPGSPISNMFAAIDRDRQAAGKPPMEKGSPRTWSDDEKIALQRMNDDPNYVSKLIEDVNSGKREDPLSSTEHIAMTIQKAKWKADFNEANRRFNEANTANLPEESAKALVDRARAEDNIVEMDKAVGRGGTGSEAGRRLAAQKVGITDDLDLVSMRAERRALREDGKLTPEDEKEIDALHKEYEEKLAKVKASEEAAKKSEQEALGKLAMKEAEEASRPEPTPPHIQKIVDRIRKVIKDNANESRAYFRGKMLSLSPQDLYHLTRIAADNLMDIGADFAKWSSKMVSDLGEWVKPHLQALFEAANHEVDTNVDKVSKPANAEKAKRVAKKSVKSLADQAAEAEEKIKAKVESQKGNEITPLVKKLAEHFYSQGITKLEPMISALHDVLKRYIPDIDRLQTMDALSGRGKFTLPNPDVLKKGVRELSAEARVAGHIEQLMNAVTEEQKKLPKTGPQRDKPTANYRQLQQKLNELMKKLGVRTGDPQTQLASALQAAKTYTRNRIADLKQEITTRERIVKSKTTLQPDEELTALRKELETLRDEHEAVFGKRQMTDEQRIAAANRMLDRQISSLESDLDKGILKRPKAPSKTPETPELLAKRSWLQALREYRQELRDVADNVAEKKRQKQLDEVDKKIEETVRKINEGDISTKPKPTPKTTDAEMSAKKSELSDLQKVLQKLRAVEKAKTPSEIEADKISKTQARIDELVRQINEGDIAPKPKKPSTASPERQALQGELSDLQKVKRELQNAAKPHKSPDEIKLQSVKTRIATQTAEYNQRLARGDFETRPKRVPVPLDEAAIKAKADLERLKEKWKEGNRKLEMSRRPTWQKSLDTFVSIERAFKLSSPVVFGKLTAAAFTRFATTLTEEVVGAGLSKALPELASRAPREGGINVKAMAKGLTEAITKGMKDAYDTLIKGETDVEVAAGNKQKRDRDWMNIIGQVHGMIKAPVKRAEFTLSLEKRIAHAIKNGVDVTDSAVQTRLLGEALDDGYRSIFMQDNFAARKFNNLATMMEMDKKSPILGKVSAATMRFLLPIVRVPMNIVSETAQGIYGVPVGSVKLVQAMRNGIRDLPPEQADAIMRNLKKGSIGLSLVALGYLNPESVGGYDWREKREKGAVKTGGFQVFGVDIPRWMTHAPWFELMQFGATIRHVKDQTVKATGDSKGIDEGLWAAGFGLLEQTPFYGEMLRAGRASEGTTLRNQFLGELLKGTLEPAALQKIAEWSDEDVKRNPKTITEHLEMGIPGLRQNVPEKIDKRR